MQIEQFWEEFLSLLKSQSSERRSSYTWEQLVSQPVRMILEEASVTKDDAVFEQLGLLGIDFKQLGERPTTMTYQAANPDQETITVQGGSWRITFPVRQCDGAWQLTSGRCEITPC